VSAKILHCKGFAKRDFVKSLKVERVRPDEADIPDSNYPKDEITGGKVYACASAEEKTRNGVMAGVVALLAVLKLSSERCNGQPAFRGMQT
jgi:hypothetical protein